MPYIHPDLRSKYDDVLTELPINGNPGDLNYVISAVLERYIKENGLNYATVNNLVGALECAKLELYRRIAAPYEDVKRRINGDVYR